MKEAMGRVLRGLLFLGACTILACSSAEGGGYEGSTSTGGGPSAETDGSGGGGDDSWPEWSSGRGTGGEASEPVDGCAARLVETHVVDKRFWHSLFEVQLESAVVRHANSTCHGSVTFNAVFHNRRETAASEFDTRLMLTSNGRDYLADYYDHEVPSVPAGRMGRGTLLLIVDEEFSFEDATLIVGEGNENLAMVPLGPASVDDYVSLEPSSVPTALGSFEAGTLTFTVTEASVNADPYIHRTPANSLRISLKFDVAAVRAENLQRNNFRLDLPDGTSAAPDDAPIELTAAGATVRGLELSFVVPRPAQGEYALVTRGIWGEQRASIEVKHPFQVGPLPTFGE